MYILIYSECTVKDCYENEFEFINWRLEKNLEQVYKFMDNHKKYEYMDCYKVGKQVRFDYLLEYKERRKKE